MHRQDRRAPPITVLGGILILAEVAQGWRGWIDERLLRSIGDLSIVGRATLRSRDPLCIPAFFNLHGALIASIEHEVAVNLLARAHRSQADRLISTPNCRGWAGAGTISTGSRGAGRPGPGGRGTGPPPTGRQLALDDEARIFAADPQPDGGPGATAAPSSLERP